MMARLVFDSFNLFRVKDFHLHYRATNTAYSLCDCCARCYATVILFCFTSSSIDGLINYNDYYFIIAVGSNNMNKFSKDQQVDLIDYLIQIFQIQLLDLNIKKNN